MRTLGFLAFVGLHILSSSVHAASVTEAPNWCAEAKHNLTDGTGKPVQCEVITMHCVKLNNYWCQKQEPGDAWKGARKVGTTLPMEDDRHHAVFESANWSARAIAIDLRSKYLKRKLKTAYDIAQAYSPWCDTKGSIAINSGHGRSCGDKPKPGADFHGPFCRAPAVSAPSKSYCESGCNCPPEVAEMMVKGLNVGISDDLKLFDQDGTPSQSLAVVIKNLARQEHGLNVSDELIKRGIGLLANE